MTKKSFPIGISHYRELIEENYCYVDKSNYCSNVVRGPKVTIITRPRRFGKTLFMSMLAHFFAEKFLSKKTASLFSNSLLAKYHPDILKSHQGKYAVIFLTFKNIKANSYEKTLLQLKTLFSDLILEHRTILESKKLDSIQKERLSKLKDTTANEVELGNGLRLLSQCLQQVHGKPVVILIDEYDTPILASYLNNYYQDMIRLMRDILGSALKDNTALSKAVITGITRIAKESLFSDLNNPLTCSVQDNELSGAFGFTDLEIDYLLEETNLGHRRAVIKQWYNGYQFGENLLYNPWSIVNCLHKQGETRAFWVNTSTNELVKKLLASASAEAKHHLHLLMSGETVDTWVDIFTEFNYLEKSDSALWHLLLSSGYLTALHSEYSGVKPKCTLKIPNLEILYLYQEIVTNWFDESVGSQEYHNLLNCLVTGDIPAFKEQLQYYMKTAGSYFDTSGNAPEKFYHGFVLGLLVNLQATHDIRSNRESGYGRYDITIVPKDSKKYAYAIIMEFKRSQLPGKDLNLLADEALAQIKAQEYATEITSMKPLKIITIGLAFYSKQLEISFEKED